MDFNKKTLKIECCDPEIYYSGSATRIKGDEKGHNHEFIEFLFVLSGKGQYIIDGEIIDVKEGDLLIHNPGVMHQCVLSEKGNQSLTEFYIGFSKFKLENYEWNTIDIGTKGNVLHTTGETRREIFKLCIAMEAEREVFQIGRYVIIKAYLMQFLTLVLREIATPMKKASETYAFDSINKKYVVNKIVNYFADHYSEKISLDQIAENLYLSQYYISRIFKSEIGESPIGYLINIRLEKAKELLDSDESLSVQQVATNVGYEDAFYFSRLFKKKYGVSPSIYKNKGLSV